MNVKIRKSRFYLYRELELLNELKQAHELGASLVRVATHATEADVRPTY